MIIKPIPITVWWADLRSASNRISKILDSTEIAKAENYLNPAATGRSLVASALLRVAAANQLGIDIADVVITRTCPDCGQDHGKPNITSLEVSVSHSGVLVLVATASVPVGVDVEQLADIERFHPEKPNWTEYEALLKLGQKTGPVVTKTLTTPIPGYQATLVAATTDPIEITELNGNKILESFLS